MCRFSTWNSTLLTIPRAAIVFLAGMATSVAGLAEDGELRSRLTALRGRIGESERMLQQTQKSRNDAKTRLDGIKRERGSLLAKQRETEIRSTGIARQIDALQAVLEAARERLEEERSAFARRVDRLYRLGRQHGGVRYIANSSTASELTRRTGYLRRVAERDRKALTEIELLMGEFRREEGELVRLRTEQDRLGNDLHSLGERLEVQRKQQAEVVQTLEKQAKGEAQSLAKLRSSARELEALLAGVTGGGEEAPDAFAGDGLGLLRGKLTLPVQGQILERFGKRRHEEFADVLFVKGLEVGGSVGDEVHAVAGGKVVFSRELPGYGLVVIIDHGKRYYSLYGRLGSVRCQIGEIVTARGVVGLLGSPDGRGRNFYFEIRVRGKAVDPVEYLTRVPPKEKS